MTALTPGRRQRQRDHAAGEGERKSLRLHEPSAGELDACRLHAPEAPPAIEWLGAHAGPQPGLGKRAVVLGDGEHGRVEGLAQERAQRRERALRLAYQRLEHDVVRLRRESPVRGGAFPLVVVPVETPPEQRALVPGPRAMVGEYLNEA